MPSILPSAMLTVAVDRTLARPAFMQLYDQVRDLILRGRLGAGNRLPSSRDLAGELGVSRTTVVAAYDQLQSEGYLEQRRGSGAFVADIVPDLLTSAATVAADPPVPFPRQPMPARPGPLTHMVPDLDAITRREWGRLLQRGFQNLDPVHLERGDLFGLPDLRRAIAAHLKAWRGLDVTPDRIVVTASSAESLRLVLAALLPDTATVAMEDPGYQDMRAVLVEAGMDAAHVAVDGEGLRTDLLPVDPAVRGVIVTPSRQFPLGVSMTLARRLTLLQWASAGDRFVIEDDFDSEYRYRGSPLEALANLDRDGRVVYLGSFSKVLFRSLRISYLVVPASTVTLFRQTLQFRSPTASIVPQPALASFIDTGGFATHLRRMRRLYGQRFQTLRVAMQPLADLLTLQDVDSGMHAVAWATPGLLARMDDVTAAALVADAGVTVRALSPFYVAAPPSQGLILGFAGFSDAQIQDAVARLEQALRHDRGHFATPPFAL
ncbi:MAG: PLP-dependent aminotransferase family protein [Minwuia sp.]|nr:PLP-dependent aminotransferase family protein [Minwuia sp.]